MTPRIMMAMPTHWRRMTGSSKMKMAKTVGREILIAVKLGTTTTALAFKKPKLVIISVAIANPNMKATK